MLILKGIGASPGIVIGKAFVLKDEEILIQRREIVPEKLEREIHRFREAVEKTHRDLDAVEAKVLRTLGKQHARLIEAHRLILQDPLLVKDVPKRIQKEHVNAEFALSEILDSINEAFEKIEDEFFRERRHDLFDVGKRLLAHLLRRQRQKIASLKEPCVLAAHNLLPSDTLNLREEKVLGFATDLGGKTSHSSILAQSLDIPAVVGLSDISRRVANGDTLILDGQEGLVILEPDPQTIERYTKAKQQMVAELRSLEEMRGLPAITTDGRRVTLFSNLDTLEELKTVKLQKAEGIGLFRTEFLYLNRETPPPEEEQYQVYQAVAEKMFPSPVIIRSVDIGGDRITPLGITGHEQESNPALGLRGIRLVLRYPQLLRTQLKAILRASERKNLKLLIPMVTTLEEIQAVKKILEEVRQELRNLKIAFDENAELGMMVEIPSAAMALDLFCAEVDFFSIGSNDLMQYLLATDRTNESVAHLYDPFHPGVLRLIDQVCRVAHLYGKWVALCGEMAADARMAGYLVAMGLDQLSVAPRMLLKVKQSIRSLDAAEFEKKLQDILQRTGPNGPQVHGFPHP
ncbi:MAG: phosphoenolpyruvate--protein phosphotransferase [Elusimicrobia bacterium]|nr:phosphoenolpyruvate--protein phosphotransferase [Elusimicrobiota bacterium]